MRRDNGKYSRRNSALETNLLVLVECLIPFLVKLVQIPTP